MGVFNGKMAFKCYTEFSDTISVFFSVDEEIIGTIFELPFFDGEPPFLLNLLQHGVPIFRIQPL